jgi:hypothetical protein
MTAQGLLNFDHEVSPIELVGGHKVWPLGDVFNPEVAITEHQLVFGFG